MKRWLEKIFRKQVDLTPLAVCRITFGLALFCHYASLSSFYQTAFGPEGIGGEHYRAHQDFVTNFARDYVKGFAYLDYLTSPWQITVVYLILLLSSLCYILGFRARFFGALALALHYIFHAKMEFAFWGWGELIKPFVLYTLIWPRLSAIYSVDRWLRRGWAPHTRAELTGSVAYLRPIQVHVITVYILAGWSRLDDPNWIDGTMLYGILTDTFFARINSEWRSFMPLIRVLCYGSWMIELSSPLCLLIPRIRKPWALSLILMHVGLEALTMVGYWNVVMIGAITTYLPLHDMWQGSLPKSLKGLFSRQAYSQSTEAST